MPTHRCSTSSPGHAIPNERWSSSLRTRERIKVHAGGFRPGLRRECASAPEFSAPSSRPCLPQAPPCPSRGLAALSNWTGTREHVAAAPDFRQTRWAELYRRVMARIARCIQPDLSRPLDGTSGLAISAATLRSAVRKILDDGDVHFPSMARLPKSCRAGAKGDGQVVCPTRTCDQGPR